jgi:hypothetical protein
MLGTRHQPSRHDALLHARSRFGPPVRGNVLTRSTSPAQARHNGDFARKETGVIGRESKKKMEEPRFRLERCWAAGETGDHGLGRGIFHELPKKLRTSLVDMARSRLGNVITGHRAARKEHDAYWAGKRAAATAEALRKKQDSYINALYYFGKYQSAYYCGSKAAVDKALKQLPSAAKKIGFLKEDLHMGGAARTPRRADFAGALEAAQADRGVLSRRYIW